MLKDTDHGSADGHNEVCGDIKNRVILGVVLKMKFALPLNISCQQ